MTCVKSLSTGALESLVNLGMLSTRNNLPASGLLLIKTEARDSDCLECFSTDDAEDILTCKGRCRKVE